MTTAAPCRAQCRNCGQVGDGAYCSRCGQLLTTGRLRMRTILGDALSHVANLDSAALRTVVGLTCAPGRVCRDYVEGKRVGYMTPLRYCVTIVALKLLVNLAAGFNAAELSLSTSPGLTETQERVRAIVVSFMAVHFDVVLFAMLPVFVVVVRLLFRGKGYNYAEVGVFVLYVVGHVTLLGFPLTPFKSLAPLLLIPAAMVLQIGFFAWAAVTFFDASILGGIVKSVMATVAYYVLIVVTVTLLVLPRLVAAVDSP